MVLIAVGLITIRPFEHVPIPRSLEGSPCCGDFIALTLA